jgi:recombinational DNA repair protein RecT
MPCIWVEHFEEMARKTVLRRLVKYLPKTELWDKLGEAIRLDENDYQASPNQINRVETLLMTAAIEEREKEDLFREVNTMSGSRADEVIDYLIDNQVDPIAAGNNYNQNDIAHKIDEEV